MAVGALVLAAGRGERLGAAAPKAFVLLAGRPLILYSLEILEQVSDIERVQPVLGAADVARFEELRPQTRGLAKLAPPVAGGRERQDSMRAGLAALPQSLELVAVHDAARPLVRRTDVSRVIEAARAHGAAILAVPVADTLKRVRQGVVLETPPRAECWAAQTPQVFRAQLLREALAKADAEGWTATDDAQLVERLGVPVHVVPGHPSNFKITTATDLARAEAWLKAGRPEDVA
jgi:2-C-methyl-D-erythritol 4-phosphate cytidylyltransferase